MAKSKAKNVMPEALKQKWIEALRSNKYKQGKHCLKTGKNSYCCLGVLQMAAEGEVEHNDNGNPRGMPSTEWLEAHNIEFKLNDINGGNAPHFYLNNKKEWTSADYLNDELNYSFEQIADLIEKKVKGI